MTQTIKFASFPFTHKGYNFISKVAETSRFLPQIMTIGEVFIQMNKDAVDELIQITPDTTIVEITKILEIINEGGTEMFLELADEETIGGND
jgi:hypothetical protein